MSAGVRRWPKRLRAILCAALLVGAVQLASCALPLTQGTQTPSPKLQPPAQLEAIAMLSARAGWAVGTIIARYDGVRWTNVAMPGSHHLHAVAFATPEAGWAVGDAVLHYDGHTWRTETPPEPDGTHLLLKAVAVRSPSDVWVAGSIESAEHAARALLLHFDGTAWREVPLPAESLSLKGIALVSPTDGWAVGDDLRSQPLVLHYDGTAWTRVAVPASTGYLNCLSVTSATDGWAGGLELLHFDGATCQPVALPSGLIGEVLSLDMLSANERWAVTDDAILHYVDGAWHVQQEQENLHGIDAVSAHDVWAVGTHFVHGPKIVAQPIILHFDGTRWATV